MTSRPSYPMRGIRIQRSTYVGNRLVAHEARIDIETRSTDARGRIGLPKAFANATVVIDQLSDTELRIRTAVVIPEDEVRFYEESATALSNRDRFLEILENPPEANPVLRRAVAKIPRRHD